MQKSSVLALALCNQAFAALKPMSSFQACLAHRNANLWQGKPNCCEAPTAHVPILYRSLEVLLNSILHGPSTELMCTSCWSFKLLSTSLKTTFKTQ